MSGVSEGVTNLANNMTSAAKQIGQLWSEFGEALSGPMARILISLYQVLKPLGSVFEIRKLAASRSLSNLSSTAPA